MNIIACINNDWAIGYNNTLLYNIPSDMEYFKSKTFNKTVIMGKNTYLSLRVKPLPNRNNIVLSSSLHDSNITICRSTKDIYSSIADVPTDDIFIIGGESIYKTFIDYCSTAYITKVQDSCLADTFFPLNLDTSAKWNLIDTSKIFEYNNLKYSFNIYKNVHSIL